MVYSFQHRLGKDWDRQLEDGLPDSRLSGKNSRSQIIRRGKLSFEKVFCADCGCDGGLVTEGVPHVFYLCEPCALKGKPFGAIEVPAPPGTIPTKALKYG